jgi:hypothetical protein
MIRNFYLAAGNYRPSVGQGGQRRRVVVGHDDYFQQVGGVLERQEEHPLASMGQMPAYRHRQASDYD